MKRLGYSKSRNGCQRCKKRRVKCDEKRPCGACTKHSVACSLVDTLPSGRGTTRGATTIRKSATGREMGSSDQPPLSSNSQSAASSPSLVADHPVSRLSSQFGTAQTLSPHYYSPSLNPDDANTLISDLELMHHYSTVTYCTFPASPGAHDLFQKELPRVALSFPYLLHQILALSASHLADLRPDRRAAYSMRASRHQSLSIGGMRTALAGSITQANCHALFATSAMLMASTCASHRYTSHRYNLAPSPPSPLDDLLGIFSLIRGLGAILNQSRGDLVNGQSRDLFNKVMPAADDLFFLHTVAGRLYDLRSRLMAATDVDQDVRRIADEAISAFLDCIMKVPPRIGTMATVELRTVFLWPLLLSNDFLGLLRKEEPAAMAILVQYCAVLQAAEPDAWFLQGWSLRVAEYVCGLLGDTPWVELARWPLGKIRGDLVLDQ